MNSSIDDDSHVLGATGIDVAVRLLEGPFEKVVQENPILFKNVSLTPKMGYPDVIMPGDVRLVESWKNCDVMSIQRFNCT